MKLKDLTFEELQPLENAVSTFTEFTLEIDEEGSYFLLDHPDTSYDKYDVETVVDLIAFCYKKGLEKGGELALESVRKALGIKS